ncbi:diguanylate cyclase domain-containing protein [Exiguobacterium acetylicum]|uniref:GGDEF domain-containing protein n=1 Tax=Exiguobacterium sp. BMC-KP TaxID=1684312 RepID=UPI001F23E2B1|nr:GGDEF domain-containing protein [Exiguobacterium sp. BMC-KP]
MIQNLYLTVSIYLVVTYTLLSLLPLDRSLQLSAIISLTGSFVIFVLSLLGSLQHPSFMYRWLSIAFFAYFFGDLLNMMGRLLQWDDVNLNVLLDVPYTIHLTMMVIFFFQQLDLRLFQKQKLLILDSLTLFTVSMIAGYIAIFRFIPSYTRTMLEQISWTFYAFLTILLTLFFFLLYASGLKRNVSRLSFIYLVLGTFILGMTNFIFYTTLLNGEPQIAGQLLPLYPLSSLFLIAFMNTRTLPIIREQQVTLIRVETIMRSLMAYILLSALILYITFFPVSRIFFLLSVGITFLLFLTRQLFSYRENLRLLQETTALQTNLEDIVHQKTALLQLREQELTSLFLSYPEIVLEIDDMYHIRSVNPAAAATGWNDFPLGPSQRWQLNQLIPLLKQEQLSFPFHLLHIPATEEHPEYFLNTTVIDVPDQKRYFVILADVTEDHQQEVWLERMGYHDSLTRLPNRRYFEEQLYLMLPTLDYGSLLFIDLDGFKQINDTYGHDIGDLLLQETAIRLQSMAMTTDLVARLGGDEFLIFIQASASETRQFAEHVLEVLNHPFFIDPHTLHITPSIGISLYPEDGKSSEQLLIRADEAMYHIKNTEKNNFLFATQIKR